MTLPCLSNVKRTGNMKRPQTLESEHSFIDICLLIDRSGSMGNIFKETVEGTNNFIKEQTDMAISSGIKTNITIKTFDNDATTIVDNMDITQLSELDKTLLTPRGCTKLVDTAFETLLEQNRRKKSLMSEEFPNPKMIFAIITDGMDNMSKLYSPTNLNTLLSRLGDEGLVSLFLGANQDAIKQGCQLGFKKDHSLTYTAEGKYASYAFRTLSEQVKSASQGKDTGFSQLNRTMSCRQAGHNPVVVDKKNKIKQIKKGKSKDNDLIKLTRC